jgi:hypothetical protein
VTDWRGALRQARLVSNSAQRIYVAVWAPYVHRALTAEAREEFVELGIGLLSVNGRCEVKIPARQRVPRYPDAVLLGNSHSRLFRRTDPLVLSQ